MTFCPRCCGPMIVTDGTVHFTRAVRPVPTAFAICLWCPAASQVNSTNGQLIDLGVCATQLRKAWWDDTNYLMRRPHQPLREGLES